MIQSLAYYTALLRKDFTDYCSVRLGEIGLSQGQLYFILYVGKHPDCSPKQLAQALGMDAGHTARTLTKLVESGFLSQEQSTTDRRAHLLHLTEQGEEAFRFSYALFDEWDEIKLDLFFPDEREQLLSLMERLIHNEGGEVHV